MLEQIERGGGEPAAALAFLARHALEVDEDGLRAATRRALLVLAAGGDPRRELSLADRAVAVLADDLEGESVAAGLARALTDLQIEAAGLPRVSAALDQLLADAGLACRWLALVVLLDELSGSDPSME